MRWLIVMLFLCLANCGQQDVEWKVGASKMAITPDRPVWLAGYSRDVMSDGVHDDVWARGMVIDNGSARLLILTADLIGLMLPDVDEIRRDLASDDLPMDHIIVTSTHTHSGPDVIGLWHADRGQSGVDFAYLDSVKAKMVEVGRLALVDRKDARLFVSKADLPGIVRNAHDEGVLDTRAVTLRAESLDGKTLATVVNYACHPEVLNKTNRRVTSDFTHYTYQRLEERHGASPCS